MLVGIVSDLHLEKALGDFVIPECDLLLLVGDIINASNSVNKLNRQKKLDKRYSKFFKSCEEYAENTVYIGGNHESFGCTIPQTTSFIRERLTNHKRIHYLDNQSIVINNLAIFGATLWTDMNNNDPLVVGLCQSRINDYVEIQKEKVGNHVYGIRVSDTIRENTYSRGKIREFLSGVAEGQKSLVMTHHAPSWVCVRDDYKHDLISYAFANTGLDDMILDCDGPDFWVHGHTHKKHDFMHGEKTRIICNARGYWHYEMESRQGKVKLIEID